MCSMYGFFSSGIKQKSCFCFMWNVGFHGTAALMSTDFDEAVLMELKFAGTISVRQELLCATSEETCNLGALQSSPATEAVVFEVSKNCS